MKPATRWWKGPLVAAGAVALVALIGWFDYRTGPDVSFTISYLLPVIWAARSAPLGSGLIIALLSSISMLLSERIADQVMMSPAVMAWNLFARFALLAAAAVLVRSLRMQLALARELARTDSLTGLITRGRFLELLEGEVRRARRYGHPLSLAYIDVDDFKHVNDSHGHVAGDALLRAVANGLREGTRDIDVAGRMGGDEFMLLMPETAAAEARALIERLQATLASVGAGEGMPVTFSIGLLTFLAVPNDPDHAVQRVDDLMYEVKRGGKDGFLHQVEERSPHES